MDLLGLRIVGVVGTRINVKISYAQRGPSMAWLQAQVLMVASPALLTTELSR